MPASPSTPCFWTSTYTPTDFLQQHIRLYPHKEIRPFLFLLKREGVLEDYIWLGLMWINLFDLWVPLSYKTTPPYAELSCIDQKTQRPSEFIYWLLSLTAIIAIRQNPNLHWSPLPASAICIRRNPNLLSSIIATSPLL